MIVKSYLKGKKVTKKMIEKEKEIVDCIRGVRRD